MSHNYLPRRFLRPTRRGGVELENTGAIIGHKTGTGDRNPRGQIIGINDAGFVVLPNGQRYTIAVFVKYFMISGSTSSQIVVSPAQNKSNTMIFQYFL